MGLCTSAPKSYDPYEISDENLAVIESDLLDLTGIDRMFIASKNVIVGQFEEKPVFIRTTVIRTPSDEGEKPRLVLVHGFASSGPLFFKILGRLAHHFEIIMFDIIGMGGSSRPNDFDK